MESIFKLGILLKVMDMVSGPVQAISQSIDGLAAKAEKLTPVFDKFKDYGKWVAGAGLVMAIGIGGAIATSATLEQAQRQLKTTIMDEFGQVGPEYNKMTELAQILGTAMAGTNKDMVDMFSALMKQGVSAKQVVNGLGESTAKLATVMKLSYSETAVHVAKFSHSLGIADGEMIKFMDTVQRVSFASGVTLQDLSYTFKHMGGSLKLMSLQGLDAANDIAAMVGMLARVNIEGETAGTAISMAFNRMAEMTHRLDRKQIKVLLDPILQPHHIKLEFFTDAGAFKGIRPMIAELEKLKPLTERDRLLVLEKIFRAGSGSTSTLGNMAMLGVQGFDAMVERMKHMASLQQKITELNKGTENLWKIMTGTLKNLYMTTGDVFNELLHIHDILPLLNSMFGNMDTWITKHRTLASVVGLVVFGTTALLLITGGLLLTIGLGGTLITKMIVGFGLLAKAIALIRIAALSSLPALWGMVAALWANPVTWIVVGIAMVVAGFIWMYKHVEWFKTLVDGVFFTIGFGLGFIAKGWIMLIKVILAPFKFLFDLLGKVAPAVSAAFAGALNTLPKLFEGLGTLTTEAVVTTPDYARPAAGRAVNFGREGRKTAVHIGNLNLPNVADSRDFISSLQMLVEAHDAH